MSRLTLTSVICVAIAVLPATASANCKDDSICVDEIKSNGDVELRARNLRDFPITYTLRVNAKNYSTGGPKTVTRTLNAGESQQVMLLSAAIRHQYQTAGSAGLWSRLQS